MESRLARRSERVEDAPPERAASGRITGALDAELRRVALHLDRLTGEIADDHPDDALRRTALLSDAVERVRRVLQDLRWLADLEQVERERGPVELEPLLGEILSRLEDKIRAADALVIREPLPVVLGAADDVRILFEELIDNALRYRRSEPLVVRISAERDGDEWVVDVADNGRGFDPHHAEQVFDPLFALVGDGVPSGSGIGLAAARLVAERAGGSIRALTRAGVGTTVRVRLPAVS